MKLALGAGAVRVFISCATSERPADLARDTTLTAGGGSTGMKTTVTNSGIDFSARGNEPSWVLDMDLDSVMRFSAPGRFALSVPSVEGVRAQDADVVRFRSQADSGSLVVTIMGKTCVDSMSGETFSHTVRVEAKTSRDTDYQRFEGCGGYLPDARLGRRWILEDLNGEGVSGEGLMKGPPRLEFLVEKGRIAGHGGCNSIMGTYVNEWKTLRFGQIASTLMACPNMDLEQKFLAALSAKPFRYELREGELILSGSDGTTLRFRAEE
jgi:heat shock protein HslJ/uncharacterized membrane protein